jgi:hypothetical protein
MRAGLLVAFGLEVAAQRSLAARVGARFELNLTFVAPISPNNLYSCDISIEHPERDIAGKETSISRVYSALRVRTH